MSEPKVVRVEIEYDNGQILRSEGEDADRIWSNVNGAFVFQAVHGMPYSGPQMKEVRAARESVDKETK